MVTAQLDVHLLPILTLVVPGASSLPESLNLHFSPQLRPTDCVCRPPILQVLHSTNSDIYSLWPGRRDKLQRLDLRACMACALLDSPLDSTLFGNLTPSPYQVDQGLSDSETLHVQFLLLKCPSLLILLYCSVCVVLKKIVVICLFTSSFVV